ncbi:MAG: NADH:flavin oxidoreductase [Acidimicrobiales bacterium]|nr:NADH:flavin oxidoreductase [Acidimicrobiales bacterium]
MAPVQVRRLADAAAFTGHLDSLGVDLPFDHEVDVGSNSPLAQPLEVWDGSAGTLAVGNRWAVLPMEGWDGTTDGRPTDLVRRRWKRFGVSGAKLVWGGEAVAVCPGGRANPNQLCIGPDSPGDLADLRGVLVDAHVERFGSADGLLVGLQLTHSGRWARPGSDAAPRTAYRHPLLDDRVGAGGQSVLSDDDLDGLSGDFVEAAVVAHDAGFAFVDVKACHGYLVHELLSGVERPGPFGGDLEGRTRFLRRTVEAIRHRVPGLAVGVRLSAFDLAPHVAGPDGTGIPEVGAHHAFGGDGTGVGLDLTEPDRLLGMLADLDVGMVCVTAGSPYYCPHAQRPAYFPPSDGYLPPHDPLIDVARLIDATTDLKARHPGLVVIGSGYSYLQEWLPNVAQAVVAGGGADSVGIGRIALSYPDLPADVLAGRQLDRRRICRTFSDCTTAPRNGLVSGCYPLDPHYKAMPERVELTRVKRAAEVARGGRRG